MSEHQHAWKLVTHIDGCHWYSSGYSCECGATASTWAERNLREDPYSAIWMDDEGKEEPCERCAELLSGARRKPRRRKIIEKEN